jgi:hypothetical protein
MPISTIYNYTEESENNLDYDSQYRDKVFMVWYSNGKPTPNRLKNLVNKEIGADTVTNRTPNLTTLVRWIEGEFSERALSLDQEVERQLQEQLVQQKVEMLHRHAEIAKAMQATAMSYLEEHGLGNARNALVALTEGLRIERESVGVLPFFEKIGDLSDDALVNELKRLVSKTPVTFEPIDKLDEQ